MEDARAPHQHAVLVVEDTLDLRQVMVLLLESRGYGATTVATGTEALALLATGYRPCLVLLDIVMPEMDGWEVRDCMAADATLADIPVVMLSANSDVVRAHHQGKPAMLAKPITANQLERAITKHMRCPPNCPLDQL